MGYRLKFRKYIIFFFMASSSLSTAQIEEKTLEITSPSSKTNEILEAAEQTAAYQLITELLGPEHTEKIKTSIDQKIFPQIKKFILLTKIIETTPAEDDQFLNKVLIRFSKPALKNILISSRLFYLDSDTDRILTLIEFKENNKVYRWWNKSGPPPEPIQNFYSNLQTLFLKYGFYTAHPLFAQYYFRLPKNLKFNKLNIKTAQKLSQFFQSGLIILGSITLQPLSKSMSQVLWDLSLYNAAYLRKMASYKSRTKTPKHSWDFLKNSRWAENFALEIKAVYEKGALSSQLFTVALQGKLNYLEREALKQTLEKTPHINNLKVNLISADQITYNADVNAEDVQILKQIKALEAPAFKLSPHLKRKNHLIIKVDK